MDKKLYLTLATIGALFLTGCGKDESVKDDTEALLINKDVFENSTMLYFDTDGNPDTAEVLLDIYCTNGMHTGKARLNIFNNAKIGTYKTLSEWDNALRRDYLLLRYTRTKE